jgi:hypothetical protein
MDSAMNQTFDHRHSGHCESGTVSALLRNRGLDLSEPMVFGIGGGPFFLHMPLIRIGGIPLTAYRDAPRSIIGNVCKRLGVTMRHHRYRNQDEGMRALDEFLAQGKPVGLQTCIFWLSYFPQDMRFQFNGHNLVAFGKRGDDYLLSDPVLEDTVVCSSADLRRARFAKGTFAPKGLIYYPDHVPQQPDLARAVRTAIRQTAKRMVDIPMPFLGVRGIRSLAKQMQRWPAKMGAERARIWVGSVVRMQEEIGTGGAGFRFMYAAFLQEASELLAMPQLSEAAGTMTAIGDRWREFAVQGAMLCKGRADDAHAYAGLAEILRDCADREEKLFRQLKEAV